MSPTPNWVVHPGFYLKEEMDERGWSQRDLAFILGVPEQAINLLIAGKRGISPDMAQALGAAFDVNPDLFANLQKDYEMSLAQTPDPGVAARAKMQNQYPIREMIKRGWIHQADASMLETQLTRFFEVPSVADIPYMPHYAKKSRYEEANIPPAQLAWLFRVRQIAKATPSARYSVAALKQAVTKMEGLLLEPEGVRQVPALLRDAGVRFVVVEKLPNAKIDGVAFWFDDSPVIGMSVQRDTIDNFWFVLRHEIEHVLQGHGRVTEMIDTEIQDGVEGISEEEATANAAALEFCVTSKFDMFLARKHPFYYEKDVVAFSRINQRHPGIIVGQMQRRLNNYGYLNRRLAKVRQFLLPGAIADGWGQVVPTAL